MEIITIIAIILIVSAFLPQRINPWFHLGRLSRERFLTPCSLIGHKLEVRVFPEDNVWGKPWGQPRIEYYCKRCGYHEEVKILYRTTGRAESEGWESAESSKRGNINIPSGIKKEYNFYVLAFRLKPHGEIVYWGDNTK